MSGAIWFAQAVDVGGVVMQSRNCVVLCVLLGSLPCFAGSSCKVNVVFAHSPKAAGNFARVLEKAEAGDRAAEFQAGLAYETGTATEQDFSAAAQWYQRAADGGNADAQNNLGGMYLRGLGVEQSDREALRWYMRAAGEGHLGAETNVGFMYASGRARHRATKKRSGGTGRRRKKATLRRSRTWVSCIRRGGA